MSELYNQKIRIKNQRVHERGALRLAKSFFNRYSVSSPKKERSIVTQIRNVILKDKRDALKQHQDGQTEPPNQWFRQLADELRSGKYGKLQTYSRLIQSHELP